jgi:hypothetical protein
VFFDCIGCRQRNLETHLSEVVSMMIPGTARGLFPNWPRVRNVGWLVAVEKDRISDYISYKQLEF